MFTKKIKTAAMFDTFLRHSEEQRDAAIYLGQNLKRLRRLYTPRNDAATISSKAAMFGLEGESLKKQSGELFLARLQRLTFRLVEGHQAARLLNSKGAMFGLDARIAFAIFGALSIIVGVSLFKAIEQTQAIRLVAEADEIAKAVEAYMLDTGTDIAYSDVDSYYNLRALYVNSANVLGWKGPYLRGKIGNIDGLDGYKSTATLRPINDGLALFISLHAGPIDASSGFSHCVVSEPCSYYIRIANVEKSLASKIDVYVDGTEDAHSGRVLVTLKSGNFMNVFIRGPLKLNQDL